MPADAPDPQHDPSLPHPTPLMPPSLSSAKNALRKTLKSTLSHVTPASITAQTTRATAALLSLPEYQRAARLSVFVSMPTGELSTTPLITHSLSSHPPKQIFIPHLYPTPPSPVPAIPTPPAPPKRIMTMLPLHSLADFEGLEPDAWGIPSLPKDAHNDAGRPGVFEAGVGALDMVVVPGVAFDEAGNRLGHGRGFYDLFLTRYIEGRRGEGGERKRPVLVGLALEEQVLKEGEVPAGEGDWRVDVVVTGGGRVVRRRGGGERGHWDGEETAEEVKEAERRGVDVVKN